MSWRPDTPLTPLKMSNKQDKQGLYFLLKSLEGRKILILTKFSIRYNTSNFSVSEDSISFKDKFGNRVILALDQVAQITEVQENGS